MFPLLKGQTQQQVANPQTYSISEQSKNKQSAMFFLAYLVNKQNLAKLALGDWLIPSNPEAGKLARKSTKRTGSWTVATASVVHFRKGNWVSLADYPRWKAEVAQPAFVQYLRARSALQELGKQLERRLDESSRLGTPSPAGRGPAGWDYDDRESRMRT